MIDSYLRELAGIDNEFLEYPSSRKKKYDIFDGRFNRAARSDRAKYKAEQQHSSATDVNLDKILRYLRQPGN